MHLCTRDDVMTGHVAGHAHRERCDPGETLWAAHRWREREAGDGRGGGGVRGWG
jgi:hypothetical protein